MPLSKIQGIEGQVAPNLGRRNLIINGAMQVHQRGNQSVSSGNSFSLDRWEVGTTGGSAAYNLQQSTDVPTGQGFANSFKLDVTTADTAMGAADGYIFRQAFEGQNLQGLKKGTSNAEQVTVQFWVKSTKTGTYILELYDTDNTRQVSKSYTVSSADTWEYKTVTFPADTSGAIDNDNTRSLILQWWLAAGSNFTSGTLNTTWASATSANRVVGQVNALDNTSNNFHVVGVQMEISDTATDFEHRSFGEEFQLCQRYYSKASQYGSAWNAGQKQQGSFASHGSSNGWFGPIEFPVTMRIAPTMQQTGAQAYNGSTWTSWSSVGMGARTENSCYADCSGGVSTSNGQSMLYQMYWEANAEL
tara:strand:- start:246 stop:1325 length:1080 start_codon:yes stop_codon:yes gene_type:complete